MLARKIAGMALKNTMERKDILLRKIANTIVANLNNIPSDGLFYGKTGVSMFLFAYSRQTGIKQYGMFAGRLLDDVLMSDKSGMTSGVAEGYAGIGVGLVWLLRHGFIEIEDGNVLKVFDDLLLENIDESRRLDKLYGQNVFSAGIYWEWRNPLCEEGNTAKWEKKINDAKAGTKDCTIRDVARENVAENLWWNFVEQKGNDYSIEELEETVARLMNDFVYEIDTISGQIAIIGLKLLEEI